LIFPNHHGRIADATPNAAPALLFRAARTAAGGAINGGENTTACPFGAGRRYRDGSCISYGPWHIIDRTADSTIRRHGTDNKNPRIRLASATALVPALDAIAINRPRTD
jgi:hypothetical protein